MAVDVAQLLSFTVKNNASDLHLSGGVPPMIRVDGDIKRVNMPALTHKDVNSMVYDIMNDKQRKDYEEFFETDFSFEIPKLARFRVNAFQPESRFGRCIPNHSVRYSEPRRSWRASESSRTSACIRVASARDRADRLG